MSAAVDVRRAGPDDVSILVALMRDFYAESGYPLDPGHAALTFERLIQAPALGAAWLMRVDAVPAGFVVLTLAFSMEFGGLRGFVDDLFVAPAYRGRGAAGAAIEAVTQECAARGVRALLVETSDANLPALAVYRRAGFVPTGRLLLTRALDSPLHERGGRS